MARLEKDGLYVEATGIPEKCLEAALDAAIAAFGDANRWDSAQGAFDFEVADDCNVEPPVGAWERGRAWWTASAAAYDVIGTDTRGLNFGLLREAEPVSL